MFSVPPIPDSVTVKISNSDCVWQGEKPNIMFNRLMRDTDIAEALIFHTGPEPQDMQRYFLYPYRKKPGPFLRVRSINSVRIVCKANDGQSFMRIRSYP